MSVEKCCFPGDPKIKDSNLRVQPFISVRLWGRGLQSWGSNARALSVSARACAYVCMRSAGARVASAAGPAPPRPTPRPVGCAAGRALRAGSPALGGDPLCAPGSKARAPVPAPPGGGEARGGAGARKARATAGRPAQGWAARSQVCDRRSQLLAAARAAALQAPQLEGEASGARPERPFAATGVRPPGPGLQCLIGVHGAGTVSPFRARSNLRRR